MIVSSEDVSAVKETPAEDGLYDPLMDALRAVVVSVFDTPTASSRANVVYGYRKGTARPIAAFRSSVPHRTKTVIGANYGVPYAY